MKEKAFELLGAYCAVCGETDLRCLTIDHIHGARLGPGENRRSGISLYRAVLRGEIDLDELQCLCANHNLIKRIEQGEHGDYKRKRGLTR